MNLSTSSNKSWPSSDHASITCSGFDRTSPTGGALDGATPRPVHRTFSVEELLDKYAPLPPGTGSRSSGRVTRRIAEKLKDIERLKIKLAELERRLAEWDHRKEAGDTQCPGISLGTSLDKKQNIFLDPGARMSEHFQTIRDRKSMSRNHVAIQKKVLPDKQRAQAVSGYPCPATSTPVPVAREPSCSVSSVMPSLSVTTASHLTLPSQPRYRTYIQVTLTPPLSPTSTSPVTIYRSVSSSELDRESLNGHSGSDSERLGGGGLLKLSRSCQDLSVQTPSSQEHSCWVTNKPPRLDKDQISRDCFPYDKSPGLIPEPPTVHVSNGQSPSSGDNKHVFPGCHSQASSRKSSFADSAIDVQMGSSSREFQFSVSPMDQDSGEWQDLIDSTSSRSRSPSLSLVNAQNPTFSKTILPPCVIVSDHSVSDHTVNAVDNERLADRQTVTARDRGRDVTIPISPPASTATLEMPTHPRLERKLSNSSVSSDCSSRSFLSDSGSSYSIDDDDFELEIKENKSVSPQTI